jgi:hypothetical protein
MLLWFVCATVVGNLPAANVPLVMFEALVVSVVADAAAVTPLILFTTLELCVPVTSPASGPLKFATVPEGIT